MATKALNFVPVNGGAEVMLANDGNVKEFARQQHSIDFDVVRQKIDEFLKGVVSERMTHLKADEKIAAILDRRIEVAVQNAVASLHNELVSVARAKFSQRVEQEISAMNMNIKVEVK